MTRWNAVGDFIIGTGMLFREGLAEIPTNE